MVAILEYCCNKKTKTTYSSPPMTTRATKSATTPTMAMKKMQTTNPFCTRLAILRTSIYKYIEYIVIGGVLVQTKFIQQQQQQQQQQRSDDKLNETSLRKTNV